MNRDFGPGQAPTQEFLGVEAVTKATTSDVEAKTPSRLSPEDTVTAGCYRHQSSENTEPSDSLDCTLLCDLISCGLTAVAGLAMARLGEGN